MIAEMAEQLLCIRRTQVQIHALALFEMFVSATRIDGCIMSDK